MVSGRGRGLVHGVDRRPALDALRGIALGKGSDGLERPGNVSLQDIGADGRALVQTRQIQDGVVVLPEGSERERDVSIFDGTLAVDFTPDRLALLVSERGAGGGAEGAVFLSPLDGSLPIKLGKRTRRIAVPGWEAGAGRPGGDRIATRSFRPGSGQASVVDLAGIDSNQIGMFLPDGRRFVFQGAPKGKQIRLFLVDPAKNEPPKPVTVEGTLVWRGAMPVSPDGRSVLVLKDLGGENTNQIVSIEDGNETPFVGHEPRDIPIRWTADGRGIYVFKREGLPVRIFRYDPWSGRKDLVKEFMPGGPRRNHRDELGGHDTGCEELRLQLPPENLGAVPRRGLEVGGG